MLHSTKYAIVSNSYKRKKLDKSWCTFMPRKDLYFVHILNKVKFLNNQCMLAVFYVLTAAEHRCCQLATGEGRGSMQLRINQSSISNC